MIAYNVETNKEFRLEDLILKDSRILTEYANRIQKKGQWILPVELKMMAHIFNINIRFCTTNPYKRTRTALESFNSSAPRW